MIIQGIIKKLITLCTQEIFGFISPSIDVEKDIKEYRRQIDEGSDTLVRRFEDKLSVFLGGGEVISFASGRMSFYSLLKCWGVGEGDEVALTGFTCSVMVNAVMRSGAKPIYVDIDTNTLGMSPESLSLVINERTKVVVAQHTFGIPCEIDTIQRIVKEHGAYLVEDCAISLGSTYKGRQIGNWGDASIFSTDHTKPLNTLVGGFVYTVNKELAASVRKTQMESGVLTREHQEVILNRYILEHRMEKKSHNLFVLDNYVKAIGRMFHISNGISPYLIFELSSDTNVNNVYPYPAKMSPMQAKIGIQSLLEYVNSIDKRKQRLQELLSITEGKGHIPQAYYDNDRDIVPLRFAFTTPYRNDFAFIDDWIWFKQPVIASNEPLENFRYVRGMCPNSEKIGENIMNFPIILDNQRHNKLVKRIKNNPNGL